MANEHSREAIQLRTTLTDSGETQKSLDSIIREGLFRLCAVLTRDINPAWVPIWNENLRGLDPKAVHGAFRELEKTFVPTAACPCPTPAHLLALLKMANDGAFALKAEEAWQKLLDWTQLHFHPDIGIDRRAPKLEPAVWHAAKAAGGVARIWGCSTDDLVWCKKAFTEDFTTIHETGQAEYLLTDAESKKLLQQIRDGGPHVDRKQLEDSRGESRRMQFMTPEDLPPLATKRFEHPPKSAGEQLAEMKKRGWIT